MRSPSTGIAFISQEHLRWSMSEKHEFRGGPGGQRRRFLMAPIIGVAVIVSGLIILLFIRDFYVLLMGVAILVMGLVLMLFASKEKVIAVSDIGLRFEKDGEVVREAIWGEISLVKLWRYDKDHSLTLTFEGEGQKLLEVTEEFDFPASTL